MSATGATSRVLIYGGKGALGSTLVQHFKLNNFWVGVVDLTPNEIADSNIILKSDMAWLDQQKFVLSDMEKLLDKEKLDAILCVAGGWAGGNASSKDLIKNADLMWRQSVWSSTIAASIASQYLKEGGCIVLPGAKPALGATPAMIGYGMAKAAVHQLVKSLADKKSGLPANSFAAAILPVTLDTPMNRKWMPKADTTTWTSLEYVAELLLNWTNGKDRPENGSLVSLITKDNKTEIVLE